MSESVIAENLRIKGELISDGDVELKGIFEGDIVCRTLMVAEDACVIGSAAAEKVVIRGTVEGSIAGNRVTLTSSARVTGELVCQALSIDENAYFDGKSQRVTDPLREHKQRASNGNGNGSTGAAASAPARQTELAH